MSLIASGLCFRAFAKTTSPCWTRLDDGCAALDSFPQVKPLRLTHSDADCLCESMPIVVHHWRSPHLAVGFGDVLERLMSPDLGFARRRRVCSLLDSSLELSFHALNGISTELHQAAICWNTQARSMILTMQRADIKANSSQNPDPLERSEMADHFVSLLATSKFQRMRESAFCFFVATFFSPRHS